MSAGLGMGVGLLVILVPLGLIVLGTIFQIWMIVDCAMNEPSEGNDKIIWILVIVFTHFLGALLYLLLRRPQRMQRYGR